MTSWHGRKEDGVDGNIVSHGALEEGARRSGGRRPWQAPGHWTPVRLLLGRNLLAGLSLPANVRGTAGLWSC